MLRGNYFGPGAGLREENSRRGGPACEYGRPDDVLTVRRIRFGGGCVPHDEAWCAFKFCAFLCVGRQAGGIISARFQRAGAATCALSISRETVPRAFRSDTT